MDEYSIHFGEKSVANALVEEFHYSHRPIKNSRIVTTARNRDGTPVAAAVFYCPPSRWSNEVLELGRLVKIPECDLQLTVLISKAVKECRRLGYALLISMASRMEGHHGGIYQAASWNFSGERPKSCDGLIINGVFKPGRSCNQKYGTRSAGKLMSILPGSVITRHFDEGKFLYWKSLSRVGDRLAEVKKLKILPYPKPSKNLRLTVA